MVKVRKFSRASIVLRRSTFAIEVTELDVR